MTAKALKGEMLSPSRYGKTTRVHVGMSGTEVSLCDRPTERWFIVQPSPNAHHGVDVAQVTCRTCAGRWQERTRGCP